MRNYRASPFLRSRCLAATLAGLLLAASLPKVGIAGLAWVAPALMLAAALGKSGWESFRIGYIAGLAYYLGSLYWLLFIPYRALENRVFTALAKAEAEGIPYQTLASMVLQKYVRGALLDKDAVAEVVKALTA